MLQIDISGISIPSYLEIKKELDSRARLIKDYKIQSEETELYTPEEIERYKEKLQFWVDDYNKLIDSLKVEL